MQSRAGFTWIEALAAVAVVSIIAGIAVPSYVRLKEKAREAEVKSGLHSVQLDVERYAVDHGGGYPPYLIGGSYAPPGKAKSQTPVDLADPLIRDAYITAYPHNPFVEHQASGAAVLALQKKLPSSTVYGDDPLRPGTRQSEAGLRFGPGCNLMGSVLADPRSRTYMPSLPLYVKRDKAGRPKPVSTYADVEYDFWDVTGPGKHQQILPGEFFYKSSWPVATESSSASKPPTKPDLIDYYMLGAYGGLRTAGQDVIGAEPMIFPVSRKTHMRAAEAVYAWTRSQVRGQDARQGSPFRADNRSDTNEQVECENPNGIRDGLIMYVTGGCSGDCPNSS